MVANRFHSVLALADRCAGHVGCVRGGFGSRPLIRRLPGLPSISFKAVGLGLRPLILVTSRVIGGRGTAREPPPTLSTVHRVKPWAQNPDPPANARFPQRRGGGYPVGNFAGVVAGLPRRSRPPRAARIDPPPGGPLLRRATAHGAASVPAPPDE